MSKKETLVDWYITLQNEYIAKYGSKTLIMMEVGSFYECYAVTETQLAHLREACLIMSIRITRKNNKSGTNQVDSGNPYMAGVTSIAFDKYMNMLLPAGYNIVRVDQVTAPPNPKREVVKVYSPGTCLESSLSQGQMENYLLVIYLEGYHNLNSQSTGPSKYSIGISLIDLTTGNSYCCEFHDNEKTGENAFVEAYRIVYGYNPVETVIYTTSAPEMVDTIKDKLNLDPDSTRVYCEISEQWRDINFQSTIMRRHFQCPANIEPHDYLGMGMRLHATISMVLAVQFIFEHDREVAKRLNRPKPLSEDDKLNISYQTMETLDIIPKNNNTLTRKNSLLGLIDHCRTPMGKRLLKSRLLHPITNPEILSKRYDLTDLLGKHRESLTCLTKFSYDLDRLHRKMSLAKLNPSEWTSLDITYHNLIEMSNLLGQDPELVTLLLKPVKSQLTGLIKFRENYHETLDMDKLAMYSSLNDISDNIFKRGQYPEIEALADKITETTQMLEDFRRELCLLTYDGKIPSHYQKLDFQDKINSLVKLEKNDRDGYHFKITKNRCKILKKNIPPITTGENWKKYVAPNRHLAIESLRFCDKKTEITVTCHWLENNSKEMCYQLEKLKHLVKQAFQDSQLKWYTSASEENLLHFTSDFLANIDVSLSNFQVSQQYQYVRPTILTDTTTSCILASEVRHPITERIRSETTFVPNPINIGQMTYGAVITGLNGVGKSIYIKSVAIAVLMAQAGLYVAAKTFNLGLYRQIFTRIGNNDNLFRGQSTFYKEMLELDTILRNADSQTLVIADELCSGSEQMSAQAILACTIETLTKRKTSNLITTHFHGCLNLPEIKLLAGLAFFHFKVEYENGLLIYNRNLIDGVGPKLYGIEVSRHIIGEGHFIDRCHEFRERLQGKEDIVTQDVKPSKYNTEVKVTNCEVCGKSAEYEGELHTHHISEQADADLNGNIDHIAKNCKGNLVVLCQKHHQMVHHGGLEISGWKQSVGKGLYLDYKFTPEVKPVGKSKKYTDQDLVNILLLKEKGYKVKLAKQYLETEGGFKCISEATIRKVWKGLY